MVRNSKNNPMGGLILMAGGILLIGLAIYWYLVVIANQRPGSAQVTPTSEGNFPEVVRVSLEEAKKAYDQGKAKFIDVRTVEEYNQGHISGALSIPLMELPDRLAELDPNTWYITYCT